MICNFCHLKVTRIQSLILVGCFLRDMSRNELDCKNYKSCKVLSWGNKKDENNKYDQNCKKLREGQNESAQGPRLKMLKLTKMMRATNLTKNYKKSLKEARMRGHVQTDVIKI